jgi:hypothetical protein
MRASAEKRTRTISLGSRTTTRRHGNLTCQYMCSVVPCAVLTMVNGTMILLIVDGRPSCFQGFIGHGHYLL